jgi:hypothetical protein
MSDIPKRWILAGALAAAPVVAAVGADGRSVTQPSRPATPPATECGTYSGAGCAPRAQRVDLARPSFSHPTEITNPLFPISRLDSAVLLGRVDGRRFRAETTLLPGAATVDWDGHRIETRVSQYTAYVDGRIKEVALDRYAQADDGSVWYLGEEVVDYERGSAVTTEGTWLAGREGPGAMIMPAQPAVGAVFRPENVPGIVFEEVRVKEVGRTVAGPRGPVTGAIVTDELHLDGSHEAKVFAPGYGEFSTGAGKDLEAVALAVPADARDGRPSPALDTLGTAATGLLGSVHSRDWPGVRATLGRMRAAWSAVRREAPPPMVAARLRASLRALDAGARARKPVRTAQAAIDAAQSILDLRLLHRPAAEVDRERFELWCQQALLDATSRDRAAVRGDVAALEWILDRFAHRLANAAEVEQRLRALRTAADAGWLVAAGDHAARLSGALRRV